MYNSGLAPNVVKTALDEVFFAKLNREAQPGFTNALDGMVFKQDSTDRAAEIVEQMSGTGYWDNRAENAAVPQSTNRVGNQQTFSVLNFSDSVDISKNLFDDDQHGTVARMTAQFGDKARLSRDRYASSKYNLGFTTETTNDGVAVFSASHVAMDGSTVSNLVSGALSETTVETGIVTLNELSAQDGTLGGDMPAVLLVPPALFKEACIFVDSQWRPTTANNDINYVSMKYPSLVVKQDAFLGATHGLTGSDTAWFLLGENHSMRRWERQGVETTLVPWQNQRNNAYIYKGEFREVVGAISWEGLVGSTGL